MNPKISVIVPVYNSHKTVSRTLNSILNQTFDDFELIVIDDGSKDNSFLICEELAFKDSRVILCKKNNGGVSSARNYGLTKAVGKYIAFVDSDDTVDMNYLAKMHEYIDSVDLVICGINTISAKQNSFQHYPGETLTHTEFLNSFYRFLVSSESSTFFNSPVNKLYRHDILTSNSISFDTNIHLGEDYLFNLAYFRHVHSIRIISDCLYNYDMTLSGLTSSFKENTLNDLIYLNNYTEQYLDELNVLQSNRVLRYYKANNMYYAIYLVLKTTGLSFHQITQLNLRIANEFDLLDVLRSELKIHKKCLLILSKLKLISVSVVVINWLRSMNGYV